MFEKVLKLNGTDFIVKLTRKARVDIERIQKNKNMRMANDENAIEVISSLDVMANAEEEMKSIKAIKNDDEKNKKLMEYTKKYLPLTLKMQSSDVMDAPIDQYDLVYLLITSNPKNKGISKDEYEIGLFDLEEELGLVELEKMFKEMYDKVFQDLGAINKALNTPKKKEKKVKEVETQIN